MTNLEASNAPGDDIKSFITKFYQLSDTPEENEGWIKSFTSDAYVHIGTQKAQGSEEISKLRGWIWSILAESKHTVSKVFKSTEATEEPEFILIGDATILTKDKTLVKATWAGYIALRKEGAEWKIVNYRAWNQDES